MRALLGYSCSESARIQSPRLLLAFQLQQCLFKASSWKKKKKKKPPPPLQEVLAGWGDACTGWALNECAAR